MNYHLASTYLDACTDAQTKGRPYPGPAFCISDRDGGRRCTPSENSVHGLLEVAPPCSFDKAIAPPMPAPSSRKAGSGLIHGSAQAGAVAAGEAAGEAIGRSAVAWAPFGRAASLARAFAGTFNTCPGETV